MFIIEFIINVFALVILFFWIPYAVYILVNIFITANENKKKLDKEIGRLEKELERLEKELK